jgi:D-aminopeptidase
MLTIAGAPVGQELGLHSLQDQLNTGKGSVIVVVATDAPVDARNLKRLAARTMLGLGRTGAAGNNGSGDYSIAFSTSQSRNVLSNDAMSALFLATIEATEEAVYNSLFRATTTTGRGHTVEALSVDKTLEILRRHGAVK